MFTKHARRLIYTIGTRDMESLMFVDLNDYEQQDREIILSILKKKSFDLIDIAEDIGMNRACRYAELMDAYDMNIINEELLSYLAEIK